MRNNGKFILRRLLITIALCLIFSGTSFANQGAIPLRSTLEGMGIEVIWQDGTILLSKDSLTMKTKIGSDKLEVYDREYLLDRSLYITEARTFMPQTAISLIQNIILYDNSVIDASVAEQDEILPLITIPQNSDKVLVGTWHKYPDSYKDGSEGSAKYGEIWVFLADEINNFARGNKLEGDLTSRFEQLIGLPPQKGYTHFSFLWVSPDDLLRPAFNTNIHENKMTLSLDTDEAFYTWFDENEKYSYENHRYPWTRLGYTYDWADNSREYGLTEFIIKKDAPFTVEKTYSNEEFFSLN